MEIASFVGHNVNIVGSLGLAQCAVGDSDEVQRLPMNWRRGQGEENRKENAPTVRQKQTEIAPPRAQSAFQM